MKDFLKNFTAVTPGETPGRIGPPGESSPKTSGGISTGAYGGIFREQILENLPKELLNESFKETFVNFWRNLQSELLWDPQNETLMESPRRTPYERDLWRNL